MRRTGRFKKSMAVLAVLSLSAGVACASEVTLYGIVDNGFLYKHAKVEDGETTKTDSFGLESGITSTSRFGIKGSKDLGNGLTVSFRLENGLNSDDGTFGDDGDVFGLAASDRYDNMVIYKVEPAERAHGFSRWEERRSNPLRTKSFRQGKRFRASSHDGKAF